MVNITVGLQNGSRWPDGKPVSSEALPDGRVRHLMADGRKMTVSKASYRLEYLSTWVGAKEDETYDVNIALAGLSHVPGYFEAWNFDINELRNYAFDKTVCIVDLTDGYRLTGEKLRADLGG